MKDSDSGLTNTVSDSEDYNSRGYKRICYKGQRDLKHRLIYKTYKGIPPYVNFDDMEVHHKNGNILDNRLESVRMIQPVLNMKSCEVFNLLVHIPDNLLALHAGLPSASVNHTLSFVITLSCRFCIGQYGKMPKVVTENYVICRHYNYFKRFFELFYYFPGFPSGFLVPFGLCMKTSGLTASLHTQ